MRKDHSLSIIKWPFYVGDISLVCLGLTIFFLAGSENGWAIMAAVISVTCGAFIFIFPFIFEYKQKLRLDLEKKNAENHPSTEQLIDAVHVISDLNEERAMQIEKQEDILKAFNQLAQKTGAQLELISEKAEENGSDDVLDFDEESIPNVDIELDMEEDFLDEDDGEESPNAMQVQEPITAMVTANIQMGIGSKLFIRGEGGGLSWEKGISMAYESLGKWQWVSEPLKKPITYRIYKNDEVSEKMERRIIKPGQQEEIHPEFS